ncbi:hypothetical protein BV25DRAFT_1054039 [Artomyces pyxidatus]|uniref:Uncharacterized protein n=1 Tax=Artomyces pyxidatus TaxID=48021 RepID=A0ACB8SUG6_9AGAM|nr:hypothetical protein BV25DRAFT_1054039 [Artomyces pyxidatus]
MPLNLPHKPPMLALEGDRSQSPPLHSGDSLVNEDNIASAVSSARTPDDMDKDIEQLENVLRALKKHRNTLSPISRLPPEILSRIFSHLAAPSLNTPWMWQTVSHVCRRWREVAVFSPLLWTSIDFRSAAWTMEFLQRSQYAPLAVHTGDLLHRDINSVQWALHEMPRIRELSLSGNTDTLERLEDHLLEESPLLETLSLSATSHGRGFDDCYIVPDGLLAGYAPRLRKLSLSMCRVSPTLPILAGLTHFHASVPDPRGCFPVSDLLALLSMMPLLETLILEHAVPALETTGCTGSEEPVVTLNRLASLQLNDTMASCAYLLSHLRVPASAALRVICGIERPYEDDEIELLPRLLVSPRIERATPFAALHFRNLSTADGSLRVAGWYTDDINGDNDESKADAVITLMWGDGSTGMDTRIIRDTCASLDLSKLQTLYVSTQESMSKDSWISSFQTSTQLKRACIRGRSVYGFVDAFDASLKTRGSSFLPRLRILSLEKAQFARASHAGTLFQRLWRGVNTRAEIRAGLRWLNLWDCDITGQEVQLLHGVVSKVWWDSRPRGCTMSADEGSSFDLSHPVLDSHRWSQSTRHLFSHEQALADFMQSILAD